MSAAELLLDLGRLGIRLNADGERLRYFPRSAVTPDQLARLTAHKLDLLAMLWPALDVAPTSPMTTADTPATLMMPVRLCGSTTWRDVPIHSGQTVRRDCGCCGRFQGLPVWYGVVDSAKVVP